MPQFYVAREHAVFEHVPVGVEAAQLHVFGKALDRRRRCEPDELRAGDRHAPRPSGRAHRGDHVRERDPERVMDVGGHLRDPARRKWNANRPHSREAARALAHLRRDRLRDVDVVGVQLHVERDERRTRRDERGAGGRVQPRRPEVGLDLALGHPRGKRCDTTLAEEGALAALLRSRELPVEEDRQVELAREAVRDRQGDVVRVVALSVVEIGDRHHVERADTRMHTFVHAHVDMLDHLARAGDQRVGYVLRITHEREDAAVVVGVGMHVEQRAAVRAKRPPEGGDACLVASFADVGHRLEHDVVCVHRG
jgi:hypothetical protein